MPDHDAMMWPDDVGPGCEVAESGPNHQLAVILLAAGQSQAYIRQQCGFATQRECAAFCRDADTLREVEAISAERVRRVGKRALVSLEKILSEEHTDLRAHVLAIRTGLEVSGDLKRDHAAPVKSVRELTVPELNQLIDATRAELDARITRLRDVERSAT